MIFFIDEEASVTEPVAEKLQADQESQDLNSEAGNIWSGPAKIVEEKSRYVESKKALMVISSRKDIVFSSWLCVRLACSSLKIS